MEVLPVFGDGPRVFISSSGSWGVAVPFARDGTEDVLSLLRSTGVCLVGSSFPWMVSDSPLTDDRLHGKCSGRCSLLTLSALMAGSSFVRGEVMLAPGFIGAGEAVKGEDVIVSVCIDDIRVAVGGGALSEFLTSVGFLRDGLANESGGVGQPVWCGGMDFRGRDPVSKVGIVVIHPSKTSAAVFLLFVSAASIDSVMSLLNASALPPVTEMTRSCQFSTTSKSLSPS